MAELHQLGAAELAALYRSRRASPVEAVRAVIAHVERCEPKLQALYAYDPDAALAAARDSEARWRTGVPLSPIDGVPGTLKENLATRGTPMPLGTAASLLTPAADDAPPAARWRDAGGRREWTRQIIGAARSGLECREWSLRHAPGWPDDERNAAMAELAAAGFTVVAATPEAAMRAGLQVRCGGNVLDVLKAFKSYNLEGMVGGLYYYYEIPKNPVNDWLVREHVKRFNEPPDFFTCGGFAAAMASRNTKPNPSPVDGIARQTESR